MTKFVVVVFPDEKQASAGLHALKDLHAEGSITLYSEAVLQRSADGRLALKEQKSEWPMGIGVGALVGGLVGLIGGPAGAAFGVATGTTFGAMRDMFSMGVSEDFLEVVAKELRPGKTAVVAEISEDWLTPLDTRMEPFGGVVVREWRDDFIDAQMQRQVENTKAEYAQLKEELKTAHGERLAALKAATDRAEKKLQTLRDAADARGRRFHEEAETKLHALQAQQKKAHADAKARIEKRIEAIRADDKRRAAALKQAWQLAKEALRP